MTRRLFFLALVFALAAFVAVPAAGSDLDTDLARVQENIAEVRSRISTAAADRSALSRELLAQAELLEQAGAEVTEAVAEVERVGLAIELRTNDLNVVRAELATQFDQLAQVRSLRDDARTEAETWAITAYMGGGPVQPSIAFNARAVSEVSVGVAYLEVLTGHSSAAADRYEGFVVEEEAQVDAIRATETAIEEDVAELEAMNSEFADLQQTLVERHAALLTAYEEQAKLIAVVEGEIEHFEGELAGLAREEASIRAAIAAAATPAPTSTASSISDSGFVRPVPGAVSSGFGMRIHPITGDARMHNGLDMNAAQGDPIRAAKAGRVILADVKGGYGNTVMIDHGGGMVTLYAHQSKLGVSVGQKVSAGAVIGYVGSTGQSTAPHLHFEVRINGAPVDPANYL